MANTEAWKQRRCDEVPKGSKHPLLTSQVRLTIVYHYMYSSYSLILLINRFQNFARFISVSFSLYVKCLIFHQMYNKSLGRSSICKLSLMININLAFVWIAWIFATWISYDPQSDFIKVSVITKITYLLLLMCVTTSSAKLLPGRKSLSCKDIFRFSLFKAVKRCDDTQK